MKKVHKVTQTQKQAIEVAREIAKRQKLEVVIHLRDSKIRTVMAMTLFLQKIKNISYGIQ